MTYKALQFNLIVAMLLAFAFFANASLDYQHKTRPFHPKPLPNIAANAVLSVFRYDAKELARAKAIASHKPTLQEAMQRYDH